MENTYAVIMAGGVGSRFWPASKSRTPKQLLDLTGSGKTMIEATVERLGPDIPPDRVIVVTGEIIVDRVAQILKDVPGENILAEPEGRNTAPCIGWAALHVKKRNPNGILAVMPSDHLVSEVDEFKSSVKKAVGAAKKGALVTFGIIPDTPQTGFGYIETGTEVDEGVKEAVGFVEKPDIDTARKYLDAGNFVWNSGMFFFTAQTILKEIERQMPDLKAGLDKIDKALLENRESEVLKDIFPTLESESIDYGVMEKAEKILCVPVDFGWSDLGTWTAAYELTRKDNNSNATEGDCLLTDTKDCLIRVPEGKMAALVGVENLIVVDTGDAVLICRKDNSQDVKKVVNELKKRGRKDLL